MENTNNPDQTTETINAHFWNLHGLNFGKPEDRANPGEVSHYEDVTANEPCVGLNHNPPSHIYVPAGKVYVHVCPTCGFKVKIGSNSVSYSSVNVASVKP